MVENFDGIVLRTIKYNDNLMIADVYTLQNGRRSFLLPVSHSKKSKVRSVLFQPLSIIRFSSSVRTSKALTRISDAQPAVLYSSLPYDVVKSSMALYLSEVLVYALREEGADNALYAFLCNSLVWLDDASEGYADFHLVFMARLLHYLGIHPNTEDLSPNSCLDLVSGCLVREHPLHPHFLLPADTVHFLRLLAADYETACSLSLNRELRGGYLAILEEYFRLHIPDFPQLRSSEVLRELFGS